MEIFFELYFETKNKKKKKILSQTITINFINNMNDNYLNFLFQIFINVQRNSLNFMQFVK